MRRRIAILASVLALIGATSACGSRLSEDERAQAISLITRGGGTGTSTGGAAPATETTGTGGDTTSANTGGPTTGGGGGDEGPAGPGTGGDGGAGPSAAACPKATKGTDTGASATTLKIATLADISGVQPGLFKSAHQAAQAAASYINSTGGICGRRIDPMLLDSKTDSGGNRAAMQQACDEAFGVAGSMSAFDDGSAAPGAECKIPDITAITTNAAKFNASNTYPAFPNGPAAVGLSSAKYIAKRYPQAVKKAAILWLNQAVTKTNADRRKEAWAEGAKFKWDYEAEVQVLEANYTRFVQAMKDRGIQYVTMVGDYANLHRLQKAMRQQDYVPQVRDWDSVAYDAAYLQEREAVEGSFIFLNNALFEERNSIPEMKLYLDWLERTSPGAVPDYFGLYAWSAYRLFQKIATQIGPELTRAKMLAALKATKTWNGNGVHGPHQIGAKLPSPCNIYVQVKSGKFQRMHPASGFDCSGGLYRF